MSYPRAVVPGIELVRSGRWATGLLVLVLFAHALVCVVGVAWGVLQAQPGAPNILSVTLDPTDGLLQLWTVYPGQLPTAETQGTTLAVEVGAEGTSVERLDPIIPASRWISTQGFQYDLRIALAGLVLSFLLDWFFRKRGPRPRAEVPR